MRRARSDAERLNGGTADIFDMRCSARNLQHPRRNISGVLEIRLSGCTGPGFAAREITGMSKQAKRTGRLRLLRAGVAAALVSGIALGALAMSSRDFDRNTDSDLPADEVAAPVAGSGPRGDRCAECGVIESTRSGEVKVRMHDGQSLVFTDAHSSRWRSGERIKLIAGAK